MDDEIDFKEFFANIAKHWRTVVGTVVLFVVASVVLTLMAEPVYESGAKLLITERATGQVDRTVGDVYQGILISERLTSTYSQMVVRESFLEMAAEDAGVPGDGDQLLGRVDASPISGTQMLEVIARDSSPQLAADFANAISELLVKEVEQLNTTGDDGEAGSAVTLSIIDSARPSSDPVEPNPTVNVVMGLLLGLMLGIVIAYARGHFDTRIKSAGDFRKVLGGSPVIACIPTVNDARVDRLLVRQNSQTPASESYRALRTSLGYLNYDGTSRVLVLTSAQAGEGKTTVTANVGAALAHAGKKVLLVGADMRRPRLNSALGVRSDIGLSSVLISAAELDDAIQPTSVEGLQVLPAGPIPPNPAELLGSQRMIEILETVSERYDYVLLDSPPVMPVTDTMVLGGIVDGIILVSRVGIAKRELVDQAIVSLGQSRSKFLGGVLNGVKPERGDENSYSSQEN